MVPASTESPIDWAHLRQATLDDRKLEDEVLALFLKQAGELAAVLRDLPPDGGAAVHRLNGSARGIGAWPLAEAAAAAEAAFAASADPQPALDHLMLQLSAVRAAIEKRLRTA